MLSTCEDNQINLDQFLRLPCADVQTSVLFLHPQHSQCAVPPANLSVCESGTRLRRWNSHPHGILRGYEPPLDLVAPLHISTRQICIFSCFRQGHLLLSNCCCCRKIKEGFKHGAVSILSKKRVSILTNGAKQQVHK